MKCKIHAMLAGLMVMALENAALLAGDLTNSTAYTYTNATLGSMNYRVFIPDGYSATGPAVPVILFLHGAGQRGTNNDVTNYLDPLISETQHGDHKAILITPQAAKGTQWASVNAGDNWSVGSYHNAQAGGITNNLQMAMNILDTVLANNNTDKTRVYVTGLSMGGYGAWDAITRFPDRFAAAMPLSGGGNLDAANLLVGKGIWAYTGASDTVVPPSGSTDMINAISAAGGGEINKDGNLIVTVAGGKGHQGWDEFYQADHWHTDGVSRQKEGTYGRDVYDWLFSYQLTSVPEPASICVLFLASSVLLCRRKPRNP